MAINGIFESHMGIAGDTEPTFAGSLMEYNLGGEAPLLTLSGGMASKTSENDTIVWNEKLPELGRCKLAEDLDTSETDVDVDDATSIVPGMIFLVESTGEQLYVLSVSNNTLTVQRSLGTVAATAASTGDDLQRIGTAHEELSGKPKAYMNRGFPKFNYVQTFRNTWGVSKKAQMTAFRTGSKLSEAKSDAAMQHAWDIERAFWFGEKSYGSQGGHPMYLMDGVLAQIKTNVFTGDTVNGNTYEDVRDFVEGMTRYRVAGQPDERLALCGNGVLEFWDDLARNTTNARINMGAEETVYGMSIRKIVTPFMTFRMMTVPSWNHSPVHRNMCAFLHPGAIISYKMRDADEEKIAYDGTDGDEGTINSDRSIVLQTEKVHGIMYDLNKFDDGS